MQNNYLAVFFIALFLARPTLQAKDRWLVSIERAVDLIHAGNYSEAQRAYGEALANLPSGPDVQTRVYIMSQLADLDLSSGHYALAESQMRDAVTMLAAAGKERTREFAIVLGVLASALEEQGKYAEACERAKLALSIGEETLPPNSAYFAILLTTQAQVLRATNPRRALILARRSMEIFERLGERSVIDLVSSYVSDRLKELLL